VEIFVDENDLSWLVALGDGINQDDAAIWFELVTNALTFLQHRRSEEYVQWLYKNTPTASRLPVKLNLNLSFSYSRQHDHQ